MAALRTLQNNASDLNRAQQETSSGLRVENASDNVAYWSISTTMKSDNKANVAANDALGVGAAKIDVAVAGLNQVIDIVSDFRAKLVTATEPSVDKAKIQLELDQLKTQLLATTKSASFSGENWLNTPVEDDLAYLTQLPESVVSGFVRDADGRVRVTTTIVDTADTSVFNVGGGGALQRDIRSLGDIGGFRTSSGSYSAPPGVQYWEFTGALTLGMTDSISFNLAVDGGANTPVTITRATIDEALATNDGVIGTAFDYSRVLSQALNDAGLLGIVQPQHYYSNFFGFFTREANGTIESSVNVSNVSISLTPPPVPASTAGGFIAAPTINAPGRYATVDIPFSAPFQIYRDVQFSFDVTLPDKTVQSFAMDRDQVDALLGTSDGMINSPAALATILNAARNPDGITLTAAGVIASDNGTSLQLSIDPALYPDKGARSWFAISNIRDNVDGANFNIVDVDITDPTNSLSNYINGIEMMLQKVIKGGASLGAAKVRLEMQDNFSRTLMDSIESGVGRLIDTDMEEASAKLAALQTQQQLTLQSLQIANNAPKNIMQLFS